MYVRGSARVTKQSCVRTCVVMSCRGKRDTRSSLTRHILYGISLLHDQKIVMFACGNYRETLLFETYYGIGENTRKKMLESRVNPGHVGLLAAAYSTYFLPS